MTAFLLAVGPLLGQPMQLTGRAPTVTVAPAVEPAKPVEVSAELGRAITLTAEVPVRWECCDPLQVQLLPSADGRQCTFVSVRPGKYLVLATAAEWPAARIQVTVGGLPPQPTPTPPVPVPPVPPPIDPLIAKLKDAYDRDPLQLDARRKAAAELQAIYSVAATVIADPEITSVAQHSARVKAVLDQRFAAVGLPTDSLGGIRRLVAEELRAAFPGGTPAVLTAESRLLAGAVYSRVAAAVGELITQ